MSSIIIVLISSCFLLYLFYECMMLDYRKQIAKQNMQPIVTVYDQSFICIENEIKSCKTENGFLNLCTKIAKFQKQFVDVEKENYFQAQTDVDRLLNLVELRQSQLMS